MENFKSKIITDYDKLENELKAKLKQDYPNGFSNAIIEFTNNKRKTVSAIRWETKDKIYMLKLSNKMLNQLAENDYE